MFGIWTKLKYQSKPIHIIATMTCIYLNNQLQKTTSISKPPFPKYKPKNSKMDNAKEIWTVLDNDWRIEIIIFTIYNIFNKNLSSFFELIVQHWFQKFSCITIFNIDNFLRFTFSYDISSLYTTIWTHINYIISSFYNI